MSNFEAFWKPEPRQPWQDWRMYGMLIPLLASMMGFAFTGLFAFAFSDIDVIEASAQSWLVIVGSALIVWGAEANTPFTVIEVFRKVLRQEVNAWDISALVASLTGTAINLLVTFASRQPLFGDSAWRQWAMSWGPLVSGVAVTLDYYGGMIELGFLFGSFEVRFESWLVERETWRRENGLQTGQNGLMLETKVADLETKLAEVESRWSWPQATQAEFKTILAGMNGSAAGMDRETAIMVLAQNHRQPPSDQTLGRWLKMVKED